MHSTTAFGPSGTVCGGFQGDSVRSFAVDFPDQDKHFQAIDVAPTQDTPYVHALAEYVGCAAVHLVSGEGLAAATGGPAADLTQQQRMLLERVLGLGAWFDLHHPTAKV
ncbi:hypothetical protein ACWD5R_02105 [Streptomyces sp. NPDC002514]|uniref:hypothetical protein n=1 Tax=Streptomyces sp. NPDC001270 TaxID=3364554 RepID=UPI00369A3F51